MSSAEAKDTPKRRKSKDPLADVERPRLELPSLDVLLFDLLELTPADVDADTNLLESLHVVATDAATSAIVRPSVRRRPLRRAVRPRARVA